MIEFATLLKSEQIERVHEASLNILENIGLLVRNEKAQSIYAKHGCQVDSGSELVRFPPTVVERFRSTIPQKFTFHGRDPQYDRTLPDDRPIIVTASSAPNIIDPISGQERRATSEDIARIAHLINKLPGYDIFSISTLAEDAPPGQFTITRLYPAVKNCLKPVRSNAPDIHDAGQLLNLGSLIAGGEAAYLERPFITTHFCPVVSPLTMDCDSTELLIYFVEKRLPVYASIVPNGGLTAPMTMVGTLVQCNAEFLATAVLMQMVHPGTPLIYSTLPTIADLRTGAYAAGGIECGMLHMACAQMARYYNVPSGGYIGLTNAKINDAQSGFETGMSTVAGLLGGADMFNMGGLLDALKTFDYAKVVIDGEIAMMLKRIQRGMEFSEEKLSLEVIAQEGPGGSYMINPQTRKYMKTTAVLPTIANRDMRGVWVNNGSLDAHTRALECARAILSQDNPAVFSPEVDENIRTRFTELVAGDSTLQEGWGD